MGDVKSLAHTRWNCKYHIVLRPNIAVRCSMVKRNGRLAKFCENCVNGKM